MGVDVKGGGNAEEFLGLVPILKDDMVLYQPSVEFVWHEPIYGGGDYCGVAYYRGGLEFQ